MATTPEEPPKPIKSQEIPFLRKRYLDIKNRILPGLEFHFGSNGFKRALLPDFFEVGEHADFTSRATQTTVSSLLKRFLDLAAEFPQNIQEQTAAKLSRPVGSSIASPLHDSLYLTLGLDPQLGNIRLLDILPPVPGDTSEVCCNLRCATRPQEEVFEALSYVWGLPDPPSAIMVNGKMVTVTKNLHSALVSIRRPDKPRTVWADALCINQRNETEKSWQVAMMGSIFRSATRVLIHIGEEGKHTKTHFAFLDGQKAYPVPEILEDFDSTLARCQINRFDLFHGCLDFCLRPYFDRLWVYQEQALAREKWWYCGSHSAANKGLTDKLTNIFSGLITQMFSPDRPTDQDSTDLLILERSTHELLKKFHRVILMTESAVPGRLHISTPRQELNLGCPGTCEDPRDIVFGLRELLEPGFRDSFLPDYSKSSTEIFARLSAWLLAIEYWGDIFMIYPNRLSPEAPSWVRDFTTPMKATVGVLGFNTKRLDTPCTIFAGVLAVGGRETVEIDEVIDVFNVDEEDEMILVWKLWHLDQIFRLPEAVGDDVAPGLGKLKTSEPLTSWVTNPGLNMPIWGILSFPTHRIRMAGLDDVFRRKKTYSSGSKKEIIWDDDAALLSGPITELACDEYLDLFGASLFDYPSLRSQLLGLLENDGSLSAEAPLLPNPYRWDSSQQTSNSTNSIIVYLAKKGHKGLVQAVLFLVETYHQATENSTNGATGLAKPFHALIKAKEESHQGISGLVKQSCPPLGDTKQELTEPTSLQKPAWYEPGYASGNREVEELELPPRESSQWSEEMVEWAKESTSKSTNLDDNELESDGRKAELLAQISRLNAERVELLDEIARVKAEGAAQAGKGEWGQERLSPLSVEQLRHRTMFLTKTGFPGAMIQGVRGVLAGDKVVWLQGMTTPLVVRKHSNSEYHEIVGACAVRGLMDGRFQALDASEKPPSKIYRFV